MERIAAFRQDVVAIYEITWAHNLTTGKAVTYGDVRLLDELQMSVYNFEAANVEYLWKHLELYETECRKLSADYEELQKLSRQPDDTVSAGAAAESKRRFPLLGAYELCLKCSHLFNLLDARGAISVTERVALIARIRQLAVGIAKAWIDQQRRENLPQRHRDTENSQAL